MYAVLFVYLALLYFFSKPLTGLMRQAISLHDGRDDAVRVKEVHCWQRRPGRAMAPFERRLRPLLEVSPGDNGLFSWELITIRITEKWNHSFLSVRFTMKLARPRPLLLSMTPPRLLENIRVSRAAFGSFGSYFSYSVFLNVIKSFMLNVFVEPIIPVIRCFTHTINSTSLMLSFRELLTDITCWGYL